MDERVLGWIGSGASAGRRRRRLRAIARGYRIGRLASAAVALATWLSLVTPALADSHSRYSVPLWTWIAAVVVAVGLSVAGLLIGWWFLRKKSRLDAGR